MLTAIIFLTFIGVVFELMIVTKLPWLYRFITTNRFGQIAGLVMSVGLSWMLASLFGAAGVTLMGGAIFATSITAFIYYFRLIEATKVTITAIKTLYLSVRNTITNLVVTWRRTINRIKSFCFTVRHPLLTRRGKNPYRHLAW